MCMPSEEIMPLIGVASGSLFHVFHAVPVVTIYHLFTFCMCVFHVLLVVFLLYVQAISEMYSRALKCSGIT